MAVPYDMEIEQSIAEIDADIRMESIRQTAANMKFEQFYGAIKRNLLEKKMNYDADRRIEIMETLKYMKRRFPFDLNGPLVKKWEVLSTSMECMYENSKNNFIMKNDSIKLQVRHDDDKVVDIRIWYFGEEAPNDDEVKNRMNNNEWNELRSLLQRMIQVVPASAPPDIKKNLYRFRYELFADLRAEWNNVYGDRNSATIDEINKCSIGFPWLGDSVHSQRIFIYGDPSLETKEIDAIKGDVQYAEIFILEDDKEFTFPTQSKSDVSWKSSVRLQLNNKWLLSSHTVDCLASSGARPLSIIQRTNLLRIMAQSKKKESNLELIGHVYGIDHEYVIDEDLIGDESDVMIDCIVLERPECLRDVLSILHKQAVFNSSFESIVAFCCTPLKIMSPLIHFELNPSDCEWDITFTDDHIGPFSCHISPDHDRSDAIRIWKVSLSTFTYDEDLSFMNKVNDIFNRSWSLPLTLSYIVKCLDIKGRRRVSSIDMENDIPSNITSSIHMDCSLNKSKVGYAWIREDKPYTPPPSKHITQVSLPTGKCPLLRMTRQVRRRKELIRGGISIVRNGITPLNYMRIQRLDCINNQNINSFNEDTMVKMNVDEDTSCNMDYQSQLISSSPSHIVPLSSSSTPSSSINIQSRDNIYGSGMNPSTSYSPMGRPIGALSPLTKSSEQGPHSSPYQQHFIRQHSSTSMNTSGIYEFLDDSASPSSTGDYSPTSYTTNTPYGYVLSQSQTQSPLVRGGTKTRRGRGSRKSTNIGDRTPRSSIDSQSPLGIIGSPEMKRPKSGPGSRGGRGSRGQRKASLATFDPSASYSPLQRSYSEMNTPPLNRMSSPLSSTTPSYSQNSFDFGDESDEECDPPPPPRTITSIISSSSTPSHSSSTSSSSFPQPLISVVPSPLVPQSIACTPSTPTLATVLGSSLTPPILNREVNVSLSQPLPPSSSTSLSSSPSIQSNQSIAPSLLGSAMNRRKTSLDMLLSKKSEESSSQPPMKKTPVSDLFDTGLDASPPSSSPLSSSTAPLLVAEVKRLDSPKRAEGEDKIILKLKKKDVKEKGEKKKDREKSIDKDKNDKKYVPGVKSEDRKRKLEKLDVPSTLSSSSTSLSKTKDGTLPKKTKTSSSQPLIGGDPVFPSLPSFKNFKIPKTKDQTKTSISNESIASTSSSSTISSISSTISSSVPPPSMIMKPVLSGPPHSFHPSSSSSKSSISSSNQSSYRPSQGPPSKRESMSGMPPRAMNQSRPKGILKGTLPPPSTSRHFTERKGGNGPPFINQNDQSRMRHSSGGYPPPPPPSNPSSSIPPSSSSSFYRNLASSKGSSSSTSWVPLQRSGSTIDPSSSKIEPPPVLHSQRTPPSTQIFPSSMNINDDCPTSPDGLQIVDD